MSAGNFFKTDLLQLYNIIQSSMMVYPKEVIIAVLRDFFSKDSYYFYSRDAFGFANTVDHTNLPLDAGLHDNITTRLFIGENYRYDGIHYPAILIKNGGSKYVPISINREQGAIQYESVIFEDGYGNQSTIRRPKSFITAGIWEGSVIIDVMSRSLRARDDLVELIGMCFTEIHFDSLYDVGLIVKPISIGSPTESDDRNDKLFKQSITLDIRTEWRREIPVGNLIDTIFFSATIQDLDRPNSPASPNLTINTEITTTDIIDN